MGDGDGGRAKFIFTSLIVTFIVIIVMPMALNIFVIPAGNEDINTSEALEGYYKMTGTKPVNESVWVLNGIYTPYGTDPDGKYGYSSDGWLWGTEIKNYTPPQYDDTALEYTVTKDDQGLFRYTTTAADPVKHETVVTAYGDHKYWDLYTDVSFSTLQKSNIFFTESLKNTDDQGRFWYQYTGYRYSFGPIKDYTAIDQNKDPVEVRANTTSLSLIWYEYYYQTGVSGQLIISGSDRGVAYITAENIIRAFNSTTMTAKFNMAFNGVDMNVYIKINPYYLSQGISVEDCYNNGYWSVMVTSLATDSAAYSSSNYGFDIEHIFETLLNLFTFNYEDMGIDGTAGVLCSLFICIPFYAVLLVIGLEYKWVMLLAALAAAAEAIATFFSGGISLF